MRWRERKLGGGDSESDELNIQKKGKEVCAHIRP